MKTSLRISRFLIPVLALGLMSGLPLCFAQPEMPPMDGLSFLKDALLAAGASALTSEQESSIKARITEFTESRQKPAQNTAVRDARAAYESAILNEDIAAATTQAQVIGNAQANEVVQREIDVAAFAIDVIGILKTGSGQVEALVSKTGANQFVRLILSTAGSPRGFGPPRGGPGPRGRVEP